MGPDHAAKVLRVAQIQSSIHLQKVYPVNQSHAQTRARAHAQAEPELHLHGKQGKLCGLLQIRWAIGIIQTGRLGVAKGLMSIRAFDL